MSYLVDGNNVMAQRVGWHRDKQAARRRLLDELAAFARETKNRVDVVFDGAPSQHFADGSKYRGVRVFYAVRGSDADERIKQMVEASGERRTLVVVTSDGALGGYARRCGAQVLRSGEFRRRMEEVAAEAARSGAEDAHDRAATEDVAGWMRYFGVAAEDEED